MGQFDSDDLSVLLRGLYEAALEPERWSGVCEAITDSVGAHSSHLMAVDVATGVDSVNFLSRQDPAAHAEYVEDFLEHDVRVSRMAGVPPGRIVRDAEVWTAEERNESPVYQDYQRKHKLLHITGAPLGLENRLTWFGLSREVDEPFGDTELKLLSTVLPHLRQALRITLEIGALRMAREAMGGLWSASGRGLVVLRRGGAVAFMNAEAEAMMRDGTFRVADGRLRFRETTLNTALAAQLVALDAGRPASATSNVGLCLDADGAQTGVRFLAMPARPFLDHRETNVLMVVLTPLAHETAASEAEIARFAALFAITPGEARVLAAVVAGTELSIHARERGVSLDTVRKQLKTVLSKSGCRSQKELVRLVERFCFLQLR